jgi:hypothetical protein
LNDEIAGQVFRLRLGPFFPPKAEERGLVIAHDDPSI